jgi:hypothetical protein
VPSVAVVTGNFIRAVGIFMNISIVGTLLTTFPTFSSPKVPNGDTSHQHQHHFNVSDSQATASKF